MESVTPRWLRVHERAFHEQYRSDHKISSSYLHRALLRALGSAVARLPDEAALGRKPLVVELAPPLPPRLRFYLYGATQHASERQQGTFKVQLTSGIARSGTESKRLHFDRGDNIRPILAGYHPDWRLFILWDADLHDLGEGFPFSKSVQAPPDVVLAGLAHGLAQGSRPLKKTAVIETIVTARPLELAEALELRIRLSNQALYEGTS